MQNKTYEKTAKITFTQPRFLNDLETSAPAFCLYIRNYHGNNSIASILHSLNKKTELSVNTKLSY